MVPFAAWLAVACGGGDGGVGPTTAHPTEGHPTADGGRAIADCRLFPANNVWNTRVNDLDPVADSDARLAWTEATLDGGLKAGACATVWEGSRCGIPWTLVDHTTPLQTVTFAGPWAWGQDDYPLPDDARIEGEPNPAGAWDRHVLLLDRDACVVHELINVRQVFGAYYADGAARWDLSANDGAADVWAGAEAAGLAMLPGIFDHDEVARGHVSHALRLALPLVQDQFVWPATRTDGQARDALAIPMGARLRLRDDARVDALGPAARVLATALQEYGAIVADTTVVTWSLTGVPDARWDEADLGTLATLTPADFDWVDTDPWQPEDGSMATWPPP